jgi:hypothetical protein
MCPQRRCVHFACTLVGARGIGWRACAHTRRHTLKQNTRTNTRSCSLCRAKVPAAPWLDTLRSSGVDITVCGPHTNPTPPRTRTPPPPQRPCDVACARACRLRRAPRRRPRVAGGTHRRGPCACGRELRNTLTGERRQRAGAAARSACARTHALFQARLGFGPSATADAAQVSDERKVAVASPIALLKACKNAAEISGMRDAHVRAGAVPSFAQTSRRRCGSAGRMRARAVGRGRYDPLPPGPRRTQRRPPPCTESRRGALLGCSASLAHAVHAAGHGVPGDSRSRRLGACDRQAWVR